MMPLQVGLAMELENQLAIVGAFDAFAHRRGGSAASGTAYDPVA